MMARRKRMHGRILAVWEEKLGTELIADAAVGATVLYVDDISPFNDDEDEPGGWLMVGDQVVEYTTVDDDASTITLATALTATVTASGDEPEVWVWNDLYDEPDTVQWAQVMPDGKRDQGDAIEAMVSDSIDGLPNGDRGRPRENCIIERDGDEWELVKVKGRPSKARGVKWEWDDRYTLTAADVAAGSATIMLSRRPMPESIDAKWNGLGQDPTEYSVDYAAQKVTWPLDGFERAGDRFSFHYTYCNGINTASAALESLVLVGVNSFRDAGTRTSIALPPGTQAGDLIVVAANSYQESVSMNDTRMTQRLAAGGDMPGKLWTGIEDGSGLPVGLTVTDASWPTYSSAALAVFRGPIASLNVVTGTGDAGRAVPSLNTKMAIAACFSGYVTLDGSTVKPAGYVDAVGSSVGKAVCHIAYYNGASPSPAGTWLHSGNFEPSRFGAITVGVS